MSSADLSCPVCEFEGPLALVRAHITVQAGAGDDDHVGLLRTRGIDLDDDTTPTQDAITQLLLERAE